MIVAEGALPTFGPEPNAWGIKVLVIILTRVRIQRDALVEGLHQTAGVEVVSILDYAVLDAHMRDRHPQILLLDAAYPRAREIAASARLRHAGLQIYILCCGDSLEELLAWSSMDVSGYVRPETSMVELREMLQPSVVERLYCRAPHASSAPASVGMCRPSPGGTELLTNREREILDLVADGMANKAIARQLRISDATVKNHVHNILGKLNAGSRLQAAARLRRPSHFRSGLTARLSPAMTSSLG